MSSCNLSDGSSGTATQQQQFEHFQQQLHHHIRQQQQYQQYQQQQLQQQQQMQQLEQQHAHQRLVHQYLQAQAQAQAQQAQQAQQPSHAFLTPSGTLVDSSSVFPVVRVQVTQTRTHIQFHPVGLPPNPVSAAQQPPAFTASTVPEPSCMPSCAPTSYPSSNPAPSSSSSSSSSASSTIPSAPSTAGHGAATPPSPLAHSLPQISALSRSLAQAMHQHALTHAAAHMAQVSRPQTGMDLPMLVSHHTILTSRPAETTPSSFMQAHAALHSQFVAQAELMALRQLHAHQHRMQHSGPDAAAASSSSSAPSSAWTSLPHDLLLQQQLAAASSGLFNQHYQQNQQLEENLRMQMQYEMLLRQAQEPRGAPPASAAVVQSLPSIQIAAEKANTITCTVCQDNMQAGDTATSMPCSHMFHRDCLMPWLRTHNSCPTCRHQLPTDDEQYNRRMKIDSH